MPDRRGVLNLIKCQIERGSELKSMPDQQGIFKLNKCQGILNLSKRQIDNEFSTEVNARSRGSHVNARSTGNFQATINSQLNHTQQECFRETAIHWRVAAAAGEQLIADRAGVGTTRYQRRVMLLSADISSPLLNPTRLSRNGQWP
ncbi:hypothetical protein J6590_071277 [Homalodisca vitripennis]|nr:hypothetical protein J6590_071277 [Homalodisca vitripennis]